MTLMAAVASSIEIWSRTPSRLAQHNLQKDFGEELSDRMQIAIRTNMLLLVVQGIVMRTASEKSKIRDASEHDKGIVLLEIPDMLRWTLWRLTAHGTTKSIGTLERHGFPARCLVCKAILQRSSRQGNSNECRARLSEDLREREQVRRRDPRARASTPRL